MAGTWKLTVAFWIDPGAPPQTGTGTAERKMATTIVTPGAPTRPVLE